MTSVNVVLGVNLPVPDTVPDRLAAASTHTLALCSDGTLIGWGGNRGSLGHQPWGGDNPSGGAVTKGSAIAVTWSRPVLDIAIGIDNFDQQDVLFAVLDDGTVWHYPGSSVTTGGTVRYGASKVAKLDGAVKLATGHGRRMHVIRSDGPVWRLEFTTSIPAGNYVASAVQVPGLADVKSVACGLDRCLALLQDGTLKAWGEGRYGQLGQGIAASSETTPVNVLGLTGVTHIAVTSNYGASFARTSAGKLWSWGGHLPATRARCAAIPGLGAGACHGHGHQFELIRIEGPSPAGLPPFCMGNTCRPMCTDPGGEPLRRDHDAEACLSWISSCDEAVWGRRSVAPGDGK